jgi:hypothetical protein
MAAALPEEVTCDGKLISTDGSKGHFGGSTSDGLPRLALKRSPGLRVGRRLGEAKVGKVYWKGREKI